MTTAEDIQKLKTEFEACQTVITALGDQTRQHILLLMLGDCNGSRVIDIARKTNLSRPAVSRHMRILKEAGIVSERKEGTRIYYRFSPRESEIGRLIALFKDVETIMDGAETTTAAKE